MTNSTFCTSVINAKNMPAYNAFLSWDRLIDSDQARKDFLARYKGSWISRVSYAKEFYGNSKDYQSLSRNLFRDTVLGIAWANFEQTRICGCTDPKYCDHERDYYEEEGVYVFSFKYPKKSI